MKAVITLLALAAIELTAAIALARPIAPYERWCRNVSEMNGRAGYLCIYATYEQCMASRTANGEWCMVNPELAVAPPSYYYYGR